MRKKGKNKWKGRWQRYLSWSEGKTDPFEGKLEMKEPDQSVFLEVEHPMTEWPEANFLQEDFWDKDNRRFHTFYVAASVFMGLMIILILLYAVSYLPVFGEAGNPCNNEVSARYIEKGMEETGAVNIVAGMILKYRAFDTFGETCVLFVATCTVIGLLMKEEEHGKKKKAPDWYEPKKDLILQGIACVLVPAIFALGIYVILNGHLSPGGGFSGGALIGAGMILYVSAFGFLKMQHFFNEEVYRIVKVGALSIYSVFITYYIFTGGNGMESLFSSGLPGKILSAGMIVPLNIYVGLEVACTIYAFYALFRKGGL